MTTKLDTLYQQKRSLQAQLTAAKSALTAKKNSISSELNRLSASADSLAAEFRSLFAAAAAAHASGEGGEAAGLAAAGRSAQAACEAANAQAAQLRRTLSEETTAHRESIRAIRSQLDELDAEIATAKETDTKRRLSRSKDNPTKAIAVKGFRRAKGIDQQMVREVLGSLPPRLLAEIESVTYIDTVADDLALGRTQAKPMVAEKGRIFMFKHPLYELDAERQRDDYKEALLHETGHVLLERLVPVMLRMKWGTLFNQTLLSDGEYVSGYAAESLREDFAECFMFYQLKPNDLAQRQPERYTFINGIYKEVSK